MAGTERDRRLTGIVLRYITEHALLAPAATVTVALSGGADSVCLLLMLRELGYDVKAAHCNFHLRGEESDRDQHFVEDLCHRLGVELQVRHFDTQAEAARTGQSIEMAARELRYRWFATLGTPIAIAHHQDDNAETLILNLVRGTGLRGLCGIQPRAEVLGATVIRPLLCLSRHDILDYLSFCGQDFVTDSTNLQPDCRRNVIRLQVLPLLRQLNPSLDETLRRNMEHFAESQLLADAALQRYAAAVLAPQGGIAVDRLDLCPAPITLLHYMLSPLGFNTPTIERIYAERHGQSGAVYHSPTHCLVRHDGRLMLQPSTHPAPFFATIDAGGEVALPDGRTIKATLLAPPFQVSRQPHVATLDADSLALPLAIRSVRHGDRFRPYGMKGTKLVADYLASLRVSVCDRASQLVVTSGDEIVWVVGRRTSQTAAVTPQSRRVLRLECAF